MKTGLDPSDALKLMRNQVDGSTIWSVLGKTGKEIATRSARPCRMPWAPRRSMTRLRSS
ncbi:MAG: hypothetical protein KDJ78_00520 [Rhodobacteraceae bacterium]|nr:hypothetical protein [Paracoccaceae bacterium]MCC0067856.1 hypothetical protein [Rhodovulum sp.]